MAMGHLDRATFLTGAVAGGLLMLGTSGAMMAQEATPPSMGSGERLCIVEPRPIDELIPIWFGIDGTPAATPVFEESIGAEADLPAGGAVDEAVAGEIEAVARGVIACFAEGQYARAYALMTDEAVAAFGPDLSSPDEDTPEEVRALLEGQLGGTPIPGEEPATEPVNLEGPRDARTLDDGRVGAIFAIEGDAAFLTFEQVEGRWLLDGIIDIEEGAATPEATPGA